jgi:2-C-methyl-D-erythritol 2,4-cyclodiphosphate synthase
MKEMRIGHGYDVHKLVEGRRLIIGGVEIPHSLGLLGHSDADVLVHAIMDSILGALGEGDIGKHFPDNDATYKDVSSIHLLTLVKKTLDSHKGRIINVDATLVMQKPKIAPYIDAMRRNIAFALSCDESRINVKATTEEHLGFTGREEVASAHAVALLEVEV